MLLIRLGRFCSVGVGAKSFYTQYKMIDGPFCVICIICKIFVFEIYTSHVQLNLFFTQPAVRTGLLQKIALNGALGFATLHFA